MGDDLACLVLSHYPGPLQTGTLLPLGNRGGFSGARLWRVQTEAGTDLCLRAWPTSGPARDRLERIHRCMTTARQAGLDFVPQVHPTSAGPTFVEHAGRFWDLTTWLPGRADFHDRPTIPRIEAACRALALLHADWQGSARQGQSAAIQRRLDLIQSWQETVPPGWRPTPVHPSVDDWLARAHLLVQARLPALPARLSPWHERIWPVQDILADIWHDHVLFEGDTVTGIIDYGSLRVDHVAADLARLLGSLAGDQPDLRQAGLEAYARLRPLSLDEQQLIKLLDETGTILGMVNWLKWLCLDRRAYDNMPAVADRLRRLVERVEAW